PPGVELVVRHADAVVGADDDLERALIDLCPRGRALDCSAEARPVRVERPACADDARSRNGFRPPRGNRRLLDRLCDRLAARAECRGKLARLGQRRAIRVGLMLVPRESGDRHRRQRAAVQGSGALAPMRFARGLARAIHPICFALRVDRHLERLLLRALASGLAGRTLAGPARAAAVRSPRPRARRACRGLRLIAGAVGALRGTIPSSGASQRVEKVLERGHDLILALGDARPTRYGFRGTLIAVRLAFTDSGFVLRYRAHAVLL